MIRLDRIVLTAWNGVHALRQVPDALVVTRQSVSEPWRDSPGVARRRERLAAEAKRGGRW